ncbi:type II toxin-antitoxin system PemK/MazF family toxin [Argonema galeatum]|uniref:type II toxin-antitoxin system PemK/MazF family toxin n=1 Tax=Argonema galeatum TaxID=2942762 RepID=UPI0020121720|nr:type II toxin-antitoxin system PemK/MazF family toxin [Argonema galeatum]MCL1463486.1 type II toxin-antitoxin system PemK/MazF family toxin [Argonema galeatum A003/A1]
MENYQSGEVILLSYPFADAIGSKFRPVLVLLDTGDNDILVARITTKITQTFYDVQILELQPAGLLKQSVVRLHKINTVEKRLVARRLGILESSDWARVRDKIQQIWSLI